MVVEASVQDVRKRAEEERARLLTDATEATNNQFTKSLAAPERGLS